MLSREGIKKYDIMWPACYTIIMHMYELRHDETIQHIEPHTHMLEADTPL